MRIALLISGRLKCYEQCLISLLENTKYDIDLFCSINDKEDEIYLDPHSEFYGTNPQNVDYNIARNKLKPWLKGLRIVPYELPEIFDEDKYPTGYICHFTDTPHPKPWHAMSMFYNDRKAFEMATEYADNNNFEYDAYLKFRSDIDTNKIPDIVKTDEYKLFSVVPNCNHWQYGVVRDPPGFDQVKHPWVSCVMDYGNRKSMDAYTQTHNFCLEMLELFDGRYRIAFEYSLTQNVADKKLPVEFFSQYHLHYSNRNT